MDRTSNHMFTNRQLAAIMAPVIVEQLLNVLMGTVDTMMVSNVSSAAISAVSLVDSINVLINQLLAALATGGTIICSQHIGAKDRSKATDAAGQVLFITLAISLGLTLVLILIRNPFLRLIFGEVEAEVMTDSQIYFFITLLSFPFLGLYNSGSAIFRAQENTKAPMLIAFGANMLNVAGNAVLIFGFNLGVTGAALSTLGSRMVGAIVVLIGLRKKKNAICIRNYGHIRPEGRVIRMVLALGIPSGIEGSMFQLGKLVIQSSVSTLGTTAIAAQAMTNILDQANGIAGIGAGIALMTVVGECIGAGRQDEAYYYIKKVCIISEVIIVISCGLVFAATGPITRLGGMEAESAALCMKMMIWISIMKPLLWTMAFVPGYGMRAAGDVKFSMIASTIIMWTVRCSLAIVLIRRFGWGPMAVWVGQISDWGVRSIVFSIRLGSKKWLQHKTI